MRININNVYMRKNKVIYGCVSENNVQMPNLCFSYSFTTVQITLGHAPTFYLDMIVHSGQSRASNILLLLSPMMDEYFDAICYS